MVYRHNQMYVMKTKNRLLFWLLGGGVVLFGIASFLAFWFCIPRAQGQCGETATYKIIGNTLYIEGVGETYRFRPAIYDAQDRPWEGQTSQIRKVVVRDGITLINYNAFRGMENLRSVVLSDSVVTVYPSAFEDCVALTDISSTFLNFIGPHAFAGCTSLRQVVFPAYDDAAIFNAIYVCEYAFSGCTSLEYISLGGTAFLDERCFARCTSLKTVVIERDLQTLGNGAFEACTAMETFPLESLSDFQIGAIDREGNSLDYSIVLGDRVFQNCTGLVSIALPNWAWWVPSNMFRGCTGLQEITLPEGLQTIESAAFAGCTGIERLEIPSTVTKIHPSAFLEWTEEQTIVVYDLSILPEELTDCAARIELR